MCGRAGSLLLLLLVTTGLVLTATACDADHGSSTASGGRGSDMFAPTGMRIHPIFTQIEDWNKDGKPDGIEAQLEFQDQFGDPTKASGRALFELFDYRTDSPDPRGWRVAGPWVGSLATLDEQHERWNTTLRTYRFQLNYPEIRADKAYVLTAVFELTTGGRFFDRVILTPTKSPSGAGGGGALENLFDPLHTSEPTTRSSAP
jgi:hypothetical protein